MITFQEFMQESSLSRIKSKSDKGGMATMSASRGDKSAKENRARAKQIAPDELSGSTFTISNFGVFDVV